MIKLYVLSHLAANFRSRSREGCFSRSNLRTTKMSSERVKSMRTTISSLNSTQKSFDFWWYRLWARNWIPRVMNRVSFSDGLNLISMCMVVAAVVDVYSFTYPVEEDEVCVAVGLEHAMVVVEGVMLWGDWFE